MKTMLVIICCALAAPLRAVDSREAIHADLQRLEDRAKQQKADMEIIRRAAEIIKRMPEGEDREAN